MYMGTNGLVGICVQALVYPVVTSFLGAARKLRLVATLHALVYFLVPYLAFLRLAHRARSQFVSGLQLH